VTEPRVEIPSEHRGTVRRARKLLLEVADPALLARLNAFMDALNAGASEDDLADLIDRVEDSYHDARRATS